MFSMSEQPSVKEKTNNSTAYPFNCFLEGSVFQYFTLAIATILLVMWRHSVRKGLKLLWDSSLKPLWNRSLMGIFIIATQASMIV